MKDHPMNDTPRLTVSFFPRTCSPDTWPRVWHAQGSANLENTRRQAALAVETSFPTAGCFEISDPSGAILYSWFADALPNEFGARTVA
jgi:hypothetical protein